MATYRYPERDEKLPSSSYIKFTVLEDNTVGTGLSITENISVNEVVSVPGDSILLYTPAGVNFSDAVTYGEQDISPLIEGGAEGILSGEFGGGNIPPDVRNYLVQRTVGNIGGAAVGALLGRALGGSGLIGAAGGAAITGDTLNNIVDLQNRRAINPNTKVLFERVNIRSFNFAFTLIPTSRSEANVITTIIKEFRKNLYPTVEATILGQPYVYKYPNRFDITINPDAGTTEEASESSLIKFKPCFLENVSVTYNPNNMAWHDDGNPMETTLTLQFKESEIIVREDVEGGF